MIKIINEENENSKEIEKWSKQFVQDIMSDPEIKELSKLPDNEYGEKAVDLGVYNGRGGIGSVIGFDCYGNGGEIQITGFDENGKPEFAEDDYSEKTVSYEEMLSLMKNEIKSLVHVENEIKKEREEKLANAKEKFSKMSQEEKDKIVMNYLMNN